MSSLQKHLSYSNVAATAALFIALGGTSYAVISVDSHDVVNNSLRSKDLRNNSVRSRDIRDRTLRARDVRRNALGGDGGKESALGPVPRAADTDRLGGVSAQDLRVRCPAGTVVTAAVCIQQAARAAAGLD